MSTRRIKQADLQRIVDRLNKNTGSPLHPYTKDPSTGKFTAQIGCYHLDYAYGGVALHRMHGESESVTDVLRVGHVPKPELHRLMLAYESGMDDAGTLSGAL